MSSAGRGSGRPSATRAFPPVGELLREKMVEDQNYEAAMREYLARPARKLKKAGIKYRRRADRYGR